MSETLKPVKKARLTNTIGDQFGIGNYIDSFQVVEGVGAVLTACPTLLYGVELEIESARAAWSVMGMEYKEDNSLRNDGLEFVTEPMLLPALNYVLTTFFNNAQLSDLNYSERCSVHVHANCRDLTTQQLATVALLYQTFEHLLYHFVGDERQKNIFCVPWYETTLTYNVINSLNKADHGNLKRWMKYTGLNLLPLYRFGTIEFRQMGGCRDKEKIINWCNLIGCLFAYALKVPLEEAEKKLIALNTTSAYKNTLDEVFGSWSDLLRFQNYELLLEEGVLNMKYVILSPKDVMEVDKPEITITTSSTWNTFGVPERSVPMHHQGAVRIMDDVLRETSLRVSAPAVVEGDWVVAYNP